VLTSHHQKEMVEEDNCHHPSLSLDQNENDDEI